MLHFSLDVSLPCDFGGVNLAKNSVKGRGRMFQSTCDPNGEAVGNRRSVSGLLGWILLCILDFGSGPSNRIRNAGID